MAISRETLRRLRDLTTSVGSEVDGTVRALTAAWLRAWDELNPAWRQALADILAASAGGWPAPWQLFQLASVASAASRTETALTVLAAETGITTATAAGTVVAATVAAEPLIVASQLPADFATEAVRRYSAAILPTALDVIVRRTREQITASTRPLGADASEAVRRALIRGIAVGANPNVAARDMLTRVQDAFEGGLDRAITIARTEMVGAYREASAYTHQANADILDGWIWLATLTDTRGCPACWAMHGTEHPVTEPGPLGHQNCRCARMPKVKPWRELGIPLDEPADRVPNAESRFNDLPEPDQLKLMGRARLAMLRSGSITWADLPVRRDNPGWRPSYAPRTVQALRRIAARRTA